MKKFLQFISFFVIALTLSNVTIAQCDVQNPTTSDIRLTQVNANCEVLIDVIFDLQTNSGNKFTFFHVWTESQFPQTIVSNVYGITCGVTNNQTPAKDPPTKVGGNAAGMLNNSFINFGFNVDLVTSTPAATGIFTTYGPDGSVLMNATSGDPNNPTLISKNTSPLGSGYVRVTIQNLKFTIPNYLCGSNLLAVKSFVWASNSNAASSKAQCYFCGNRQVYGDPAISGSVNCTNPRTYNVFIDSKFENPLGTAATISGTYNVFIDDNRNGLVDPTEEANLKITNTPKNFTTSLAGAPSGFTSRFTAFNQPYEGVVLGLGDEKSTDPLIVRVTVTTVGYSGNIEGSLFNSCATLPVSLKSFNATQRNNKAFLTWETDQESNNDGFEVERRSAGNSQYQKIAFVDSKAPNGTGTAVYSYSFDDNLTLSKGVTYYRLRQVDLDGRVTYSEIKAVRAGNSNLVISIYPNPSRGTANVAIPEGSGKMDVSLDDYTGKSIQRWNGISVRNLQINNMKPGIYMLRINLRESGEIITERIVVQ
ncbi:T9SS type A sorting domain-containing protein [Lacibacter sp. H407]|uniref:T9SS type A sorting domain-containing protein n=1 Tax=Lacibacter sp. H407 TaxID=3133423 RepID=UPI0030C43C0E